MYTNCLFSMTMEYIGLQVARYIFFKYLFMGMQELIQFQCIYPFFIMIRFNVDKYVLH